MKIAMIADLHIGVKHGDDIWFASQRKFYTDQLVPELTVKGITELWILGDVFDSRPSITILTINRVIDLFKNVLKDFKIRIIVGNHDMFYNSDLKVNSLRILELIPNVTVYDEQVADEIDGKKILFLPWITDYKKEDLITGTYDYCFAHADIIGFDCGGGRPSDSGLQASYLLDHFNTVYSGHYHSRTTRHYEEDKSISYLGAPYQLTRIDRDGIRGYDILDIGTGEKEFVENKVSIKFTKHTYPNANMDIVPGNVVDMDIPYEFRNDTRRITDYITRLEELHPAYPVNINYLSNTEDTETTIDTTDLNLIKMVTEYLEQYETAVNKDKIFAKFSDLYNLYKDQA